MIKLTFEGGLGNQMFQYAFGRYVEQLFNETVYFDISKYKFESSENREFELFSFNINPNWKELPLKKNRISRLGFQYILYCMITAPYILLNSYLVKKNKRTRFNNLYQKLINLIGFYRVHYGMYKNPRKSLFPTKTIRGHWFWPEMVEKIDPIIRKELQVIRPMSESNAKFLYQIQNSNSVGVHIRRGDYVKLGLVVCDIHYYERCINKMIELVENPTFFIFSDDIPWVKQNLKTNHDTKLVFIDNDNPSPEDMRLLYNCNHFIMSNSTFSWWGAYLGNYQEKKVIVPEYWSIKKKKSSLILDSWIIERNL